MLDSLLQNLNSNLSNTTKLMLLDSLLQEATAGAMYVCIILKLWGHLSEDSELVLLSLLKLIVISGGCTTPQDNQHEKKYTNASFLLIFL